MPRSRTCQWKRALELGAVVGLDDLDRERELLEDVVDELDRGLLVVAVVDPQDPDPGAVIDRGELVVLLAAGGAAGQRLDELHVDLDPVAGQRLLVALPAVVVALVALRAGSRFMSRRLRIRHTPDGLMATSW